MWIKTQTGKLVNADNVILLEIVTLDRGNKSNIVAQTDEMAIVLGKYNNAFVAGVFDDLILAMVSEYRANIYIMPQD